MLGIGSASMDDQYRFMREDSYWDHAYPNEEVETKYQYIRRKI